MENIDSIKTGVENNFKFKTNSNSTIKSFSTNNSKVEEFDVSSSIAGDLNSDGVVNASDAATLLDIESDSAAGNPLSYEQERQYQMSDLNNDGVVNASDAQLILDYAASMGASNEYSSFSDYLIKNNIIYPSTNNTSFINTDLNSFMISNGSSIEEFNYNIRESVISAGAGTVNGVLAAAASLIGGLSKYDCKLPYISSIKGKSYGKYKEYGVDPSWGTFGNWYSSDYGRTYKQNGLDCSGFVSWLLHNGGYKYQELHSSGFCSLGDNYSMSDYTGKAGDLLWRSGHIALILGVESDGYVVAQEAGGDNGLVVSKTSFDGKDSVEKKAFTTIIDMTSYYNNPDNMDLAYFI